MSSADRIGSVAISKRPPDVLEALLNRTTSNCDDCKLCTCELRGAKSVEEIIAAARDKAA